MKMRGTDAKSIWAFFLAIFLAIGAAVVILPGCSDEDCVYCESSPQPPPQDPS